jgi:hypothetical protein
MHALYRKFPVCLLPCFRESLSDNLNRTIANLREIFNDHGFGFSLFKDHFILPKTFDSVQRTSVMWMFKKVGRVDILLPRTQDPSATQEQDDILEIALENDMEDFDIVDSDEGKQLIKVCLISHAVVCFLVDEFGLFAGLLSTRTRCSVGRSSLCAPFC